MFCVSSVWLAVIWNGEVLEYFQPSRGLCQGDPLSPYSFVLCMEVLGQRIAREVSRGSWKAVKIARGCPMVSYLFFADDVVLFREVTHRQACVIKKVIREFCGISGQKIITYKSRIFVSPNMSQSIANALSSNFDIPITDDLGRYLGVPLLYKRMNKGTFTHVVNKVR